MEMVNVEDVERLASQKTDITLSSGVPVHETDSFVKKLHHGSGHAPVPEMHLVLSMAGAPAELLRRVKLFRCVTCDAI